MQTIGFLKRMLVIAYDGLLLFSVAFFLSAILMGVFQWLAPTNFFIDPILLENPGMRELSPLGRTIGTILVSVNCLTVSFVFYAWFWTHGGQTLGMKAWNLFLIKPDGKFIDWNTAAKRYLAALFSWAIIGIGFTWILLDPRKRTWHDIISDTQIVYLPPKPQ